MKIELEDTRRVTPTRTMPDSKVMQKVAEWRQEIDGYYSIMQNFRGMMLDEILLDLSSFSARMNAIRTTIVRSESRLMNNFRTKEIDPFIEECDRQFKIYSRVGALQKQEFDMTRGVV